MERAVVRDGLTRPRIVLDRLPQCHADGEDQSHDENAHAPPDNLVAPPMAPTLVALGRVQCIHGL